MGSECRTPSDPQPPPEPRHVGSIFPFLNQPRDHPTLSTAAADRVSEHAFVHPLSPSFRFPAPIRP